MYGVRHARWEVGIQVVQRNCRGLAIHGLSLVALQQPRQGLLIKPGSAERAQVRVGSGHSSVHGGGGGIRCDTILLIIEMAVKSPKQVPPPDIFVYRKL